MTKQDWIEFLFDKNTLMITAALVVSIVVLIFIRRTLKKLSAYYSPRLELIDVKLLVPKPDMQYGEVHFTLANKGRGKAKVNALAVHQIASGQSTRTRDLLPPKKAKDFSYRVDLRSDKKTAEVRAIKPPHKAARPLLSKKEQKNYVVQLVSDEYAWYRLMIIVKWHDTNKAKSSYTLQSKEMYIEFQPN